MVANRRSRIAELLSLLDMCLVVAFQKCQESQGSTGSWSRDAGGRGERKEDRGDRKGEGCEERGWEKKFTGGTRRVEKRKTEVRGYSMTPDLSRAGCYSIIFAMCVSGVPFGFVDPIRSWPE